MGFTQEAIRQLEDDRQQVAAIEAKFLADNHFSWRVKSILEYNPYMSNNLDAVMQMAQMPISDSEVMANAGALYGMQNAKTLAAQIAQYSPSVQRSIFATLTPAQQGTLQQMGFKPSMQDVDHNNLFESIFAFGLDKIGDVASFVLRGIGPKVLPIIKPGLELMDATGRLMGRPYRTIRQLGTDGQIAALIGGVAAAAGYLLAVPTGGASLGLSALAGSSVALGTSALAGATAASFIEQAAVMNTDDWFNAWYKAGDGERLFSKSGINKADEILGDPRLIGLAKKVAMVTDNPMSLSDMAQAVAGVRDATNQSVQQNRLDEIARDLVPESDPRFPQVYTALSTLIGDPIFQDAVVALQESKISVGRDIANLLPIDPGSGSYRMISGSIDAASVMIMDPFLMAGKAARIASFAKRGMKVADGVSHAAQFRKIAARPEMMRKWEVIADALNTGSTRLVRRYAKDWLPAWNELVAHHQMLNELAGGVTGVAEAGLKASYKMTADDVVEFLVGYNQLKSVMQGIGVVQGVSYGMLKGLNRTQYALRSTTGVVSDFMRGIVDVNIEKILPKLAENPEALKGILKMMPPEWQAHFADATKEDLPGLISKFVEETSGVAGVAYEKGRAAANVPFLKTMAQIYDGMATMVPRGKTIAIDAAMRESVNDIDNYIDLFKAAGVPSYIREMWKRSIYQSPDVSTRLNTLSSMMDSIATATGMRSTTAGSQVLDNYLYRIKQEYAFGNAGTTRVDDVFDVATGALPERDTAQMMSIPDLTEIRKAVRQGTLMRTLIGVSDATPIEAFQKNFWKPAVLLRFGFMVRNVTEDMLAFIARSGVGHLTQEFGARSIAQQEVFKQAEIGRFLMGDEAYLSPASQWQRVRRFDVPAHVRPVVRAVEKFGDSGSPWIANLANYGKWLRTKLESGVLYKTSPQGVEMLTGARAEGENFLQYVYRNLTGTNPDPAIVSQWSRQPAILKENLRRNLESLVLGNEYSVRRMLSGGVNRDLIEAAVKFQSKHLEPILQRVGAISIPDRLLHGPGDVIERTITNDAGAPELVMMRVNGERSFVNESNQTSSFIQDHHHAVHMQTQAVADDAMGARALYDVQKIYDSSLESVLPADVRDEIIKMWRDLRNGLDQGKVNEDFLHLAMIVLEPSSSPSVQKARFQAFISSRKNIGFGETEDALIKTLATAYPGMSMPTPDEFIDLALSLRGSSATMKAAGITDPKPVLKLVAALNTVEDPAARWWMLANIGIDLRTGGRHLADPTFYRSFAEARSVIRDRIVDEINTGQWDWVLSRARDYEPGVQGTKFYVINQPEGRQIGLTNEMLQRQGLILSSGEADVIQIANMLGIDMSTLDDAARGAMSKIAQDFVDSLRSGNPFIISNEMVARQFNSIASKLFKSELNLSTPARLTNAWLPVAEKGGIAANYPELATRSHWLEADILGGKQKFTSVHWDPTVYPTPDHFLETAPLMTIPEKTVNRLLDVVEQRTRGGRRIKLVVRPGKSVFHNVGGTAVELPEGTVIDDAVNLFSDSKLSKSISKDNHEFLKATEVSYAGNESVMWNIVAPIVYDSTEEMAGKTVRAVKNYKTVTPTRLQQQIIEEIAGGDLNKLEELGARAAQLPTDSVRLRAASVSDVKLTPAEMRPDWEIAQTYQPMYKNTWDKVKEVGFNKILSPGINAMARTPMAFHAFANAYKRNMAAVSWLYRGTEEEAQVGEILSRMVSEDVLGRIDPKLMSRYGDAGRMVGSLHGVDDTAFWNDGQALAYLRSLSDDEIDNLATQVDFALGKGKIKMPANKAKALAGFVTAGKGKLPVLISEYENDAWWFLDRIDSLLGEGASISGKPDYAHLSELVSEAIRKGKKPADLPEIRLARALTSEDWKTIQSAARLKQTAATQAEEYAAEYAIRDIMPYIDTHEFRSQFADWGRGFLPFWYAEENFLKRWARIFSLDGPLGSLATARKLQLGANGLRTMGVVRTDAQGNSYFVYPGSDLFIDIMGKIPGMDLLPVQAMFQTPTERMIPGFNPQFGAPGLSPLVGLPVEILTHIFPESPTIKNFQRSVFGDIVASQDIIGMIFPTQVTNTIKAIYEYTQPYDSQGNERLNSAWLAAIQQLDATGNGLPDNATPEQVDEFLRKTRNHARIITLSQALAGWFTPGPAQVLQTTEDQSSLSFLTEGQVVNPSEFMSKTYLDLVKNLGIEEGTIAYLERYPANTVKDIVNPLAYTVFKTTSKSGAPLPMSEDGIKFYEDNKQVFDQYEFAGPWLLPQDASNLDERSQYAYDAQLIYDMRNQKTPEEFVKELKYREGAYTYFKARKEYLDQHDIYASANKPEAIKVLRSKWDMFAKYWQATHPVFAEQLTSSDSRQRRTKVIDQMRLMLNDPEAPQASHFPAMKTLMDAYDGFMIERSRLSLDKTARGRALVERMKKSFDEWVTAFVDENPMVNSFWLSILRPESGLD